MALRCVTRSLIVSTVGLFLVVGGCRREPVPWVEPPDGTWSTRTFPLTQNQVDILFVLDNSASTEMLKKFVSTAFPQLLEALDAGTPRLADLDLHVGVTSTDLGAGPYAGPTGTGCSTGGDGGQLQSKATLPGCPVPSETYLAIAKGKVNATGSGNAATLAGKVFDCIAQLGTAGCGFEMPLEAARKALSDGKNPGFLRRDSLLGLVLVADEDDCSVKDPELLNPANKAFGAFTSFRCFQHGVQCDINDGSAGVRKNCKPAYDYLFSIDEYESFFRGLRPDGQFLPMVIAIPAEPVEVQVVGGFPMLMSKGSCLEGGTVGIRLAAFIEQFAGSVFLDKCSKGYSGAMTRFGEGLKARLGLACLPKTVDADPSATGTQPTCTVKETTSSGSTVIPACAAKDAATCDPCPCWTSAVHAACDDASGLALTLRRTSSAATGATLTLSCLVPRTSS